MYAIDINMYPLLGDLNGEYIFEQFGYSFLIVTMIIPTLQIY